MVFMYPARSRQSGFTLIELLVVIMIIGILAALAIPMLISQRDKGHNAHAQAMVRYAATAAMSYYIEDETYRGLDNGVLHRVDPAFQTHGPSVLTPGKDADPKAIWIGTSMNGLVHRVTPTTPADQVIVMCSVSQGTSIACMVQSHNTGLIAFKEFNTERPQDLEQVGGVGVMPDLSGDVAEHMGAHTTVSSSRNGGGWTAGF